MGVLQRRICAIFATLFLLLVVAAGRALYLGVLHGASLRRAASEEHLTLEAVHAPRGTISDDHGIELAVSEPAQDPSAHPELIRDPLQDAHELAPLLGLTFQDVLVKLSARSGFVYLARALP